VVGRKDKEGVTKADYRSWDAKRQSQTVRRPKRRWRNPSWQHLQPLVDCLRNHHDPPRTPSSEMALKWHWI
jgi:hypothetical protein